MQRISMSLVEATIALALLAILALSMAPRLAALDAASDLANTHQHLRDFALALDAYRVDHTVYPPGNSFGLAGLPASSPSNLGRSLIRLSSPVAYVPDAYRVTPWVPTARRSASTAAGLIGSPPILGISDPIYGAVGYIAFDSIQRSLEEMDSGGLGYRPAAGFLLQASGPKLEGYNLGGVMSNASGDGRAGTYFPDCLNLIYDPTNGTTSFGNVFTIGGEFSTGYGHQMLRAVDAATVTLGTHCWQEYE